VSHRWQRWQRNRIRNEDIRNIREIQDGPESEDRVNGTDDNRLAKIAKEPNASRPPERLVLQNVGAKAGHRHRRRTGALDKIQRMVLEEEEEEEEEESARLR